VREHGITPSKAAYMSSSIWAGILFGRLVLSALSGGRLPVKPRGDGRESLLVLCAFCCTLFLLLALLARNVWSALAFLFLTGFGYSGISPLVMNLVGGRYRTGAAVGFISTGGGAGSLVFPFVLAFHADRVGLRWAFFFCLFLNGVLFVLTFALRGLGRVRPRQSRGHGMTPEGAKARECEG
jgi:DHA1 family multidrug resistance protein-like MFS transporter